jgi:integrase
VPTTRERRSQGRSESSASRKCTASQSLPSLRGDGPRLRRLRPSARRGAVAQARRLRRRDLSGLPHRPRGDDPRRHQNRPRRDRRRLRHPRFPATLAWMLEAQINLNGPDCQLLFSRRPEAASGASAPSTDLWKPTQKASGLDIRPHECRHSYVTHLRVAGVNDADLAEIVGHRAETMLARYTHPMGTASTVSVGLLDKPIPTKLSL